MANSTVYPYGTGGSLPASVGIINDLVTGGADKALAAQQGIVINEKITYALDLEYTMTTPVHGRQSYGTVGSQIQIGALSGMEYAKITGSPGVVRLKTLPAGSIPSSYIQYVDDSDNIIALVFTSVTVDTVYEHVVDYPAGATGLYVNGQIGTVEVVDKREIKDVIGAPDDLQIPALNIVDAINMILNTPNTPDGSGINHFCDFGVMPSCVYGETGAFLGDGTIDSATARIKYSDVIAKYDALMARYPNIITKTSAGYDASETIEMFYYTFTPKYWKQSIYLQAGVHGWEPDPVFALAEIMYLVANAYGTSEASDPYVANNPALMFLRGNVKITVFPVVNPWGFNNRGDCGLDKRSVAQNNYNGVQLNGAWGGTEPEAVAVRTLVASLAQELSFAIDMHSTVWSDSRARYGCFYGGVNRNAENVRTIYRTYEWLYQFYNVKYPDIVDGDQCPNQMGNYASIGYMTGTFNSYFYTNYGIQTSTMEFSDHVWTSALHTSIALSVAVNMYLNQIIQQLNDVYKSNTATGIPASDNFPAKG
jgi:hypothetical protein